MIGKLVTAGVMMKESTKEKQEEYEESVIKDTSKEK